MKFNTLLFAGLLGSAMQVGVAQTQSSGGSIVENLTIDKLPEIVKLVRPEYPAAARAIGLEGTVWVKVWVGKDGNVKDASVAKSEKEIFNEPAVAAAKQLKFTPAQVKDVPVDTWIKIPFIFRKGS